MTSEPPSNASFTPIGHVESSLVERAHAPRQGDEGAADAWLRFHREYEDALRGLQPGEEVLLFTWLDRADRSVLRVHPRDDPGAPLLGVFSTRSADRPNPIGLHRVRLIEIARPTLIRVGPLEALDGTPILDIKPLLDSAECTPRMRPFPAESSMRWRRLDGPGHETARVRRSTTGWLLTGEVEVGQGEATVRVRYAVECDPQWRTRGVSVEGEEAGVTTRIVLSADGAGSWASGGTPMPELNGALDIDLGFTPATNLLPIRRLALAVGDSARVQTAWVRFPEMRVEVLDQTYTREAEQRYHYQALVDGEPFSARLDVDACGQVRRYEQLWEAEPPEPAAQRIAP